MSLKVNPYLAEIGLKVRAARKAQKIPINEMAKAINMDMANLSHVERGMRNTHILNLKNIADVLKMDIKDFL